MHDVTTAENLIKIEGNRVNEVAQRRPRRAVRVEMDLVVTLLVKSEDVERMQAGFAANISDRGLRIRTRSGLDPGQWVYVFSPGTGLKFGACRVVWTQTIEQGSYVESGLEVLM